MAETITPVVHGGRRGAYLFSSVLHVVGATVTAAAFGAALGGVGALLRAPWDTATPVAVAVVAFVYLLRESLRVPVPLPDRKRQVPEWWRTFFSPPVAAFLYGAGLGVGVLTYLTFGTFAAVMAGAVASGDVLTGVVLCAPFGLARGLAVTAATWHGRPVDRLDDLAGGPRLRGANAVMLAAVAAVAVGSVL
jgi:cytochrome c biogenesis protein CcdA